MACLVSDLVVDLPISAFFEKIQITPKSSPPASEVLANGQGLGQSEQVDRFFDPTELATIKSSKL